VIGAGRSPGWWLAQAADPLAVWLGKSPGFFRRDWPGGWLVGSGDEDSELQWLVIHAAGPEGRAALESGLAELRARNLPGCVAVSAELGAEFEDLLAGATPHPDRILRHEWIDLADLPAADGPVDVRVVRTAEDFRSSLRVLNSAFWFGAAFMARTFPPDWLRQPRLTLWLGSVDGTPASVVVGWRRDEIVYILSMGTHPDYRRRGLAKRLLIHALTAEREQGGRYAHLVSSAVGAKLYRSTGFVRLADHPLAIVLPSPD
jgi:ribosomal protein S18 acetylase RimI-like enzyme